MLRTVQGPFGAASADGVGTPPEPFTVHPMTNNPDHPTRTLWRGLHFGCLDDAELAELTADPAAWLGAHVDVDDLGIHWTDSPTSAWNFSQNRDPDGWADDSSDDEADWSVGVVVQAVFPASAVLDLADPEWADWAATNAVLDPSHPEQEVTVRQPETASAVTVVVTLVGPDGSERTLVT